MNRYLSIVLILAMHPVVAQTKYHVTEYTTANGLPTNVVHDMVQDGLGFIWLSTDFNVVRFDGYEFRNYDIEGIRQHNVPPDLYVDQYGILWVSFLDELDKHPIYKYNRSSGDFVWYEPSLTMAAQHFCQDKKGLIWLGSGWASTGAGLNEFNPNTGETVNYSLEDEDSVMQVRKNFIHSIEDRDSCLYLITENGLWKFDKTRKTFSRPPINPKDTAIVFSSSFLYRVHQGSGGQRKWAWARSPEGERLIKIDPDFNIITRFDAPSDWWGADVDSEDIFWGRTREGIYRYDFEKGSSELIVKGRDVAAFMVDRENNLWVAGVGLAKYTRIDLSYQVTPIRDFPMDAIWASIATVKSDAGRENFAITGGASSYNGIWTALLDRDSIEVNSIELPDDLVKGNWFTKSYAGRNHLWVAALANGSLGIPIDKSTGLLSSKDIRRFFDLPDFRITDRTNRVPYLGKSLCVYEDASSHLWVGTYGDGMSKVNLAMPYGSAGSVVQFKNVPGDTNSLIHHNVTQIFPLDSSALLVGTPNGVDLFADGKFKHVIKGKAGFYFLKTRRDGLYVSTSDGLYYSDKARNYSHFEKVLDGIKGAILEDEENRIWMLTPNGVEVFEPSTAVTISFSDLPDLEVFNEFSPSFSKTSGNLFGLVTKAGLVTFNPSEFRISQRPAYPVLTSLTVNHKPVVGNQEVQGESFALQSDITVLDELVIDHLHNNFSIEFSSMDMIAPERNRYRHKLEGYDEEWIETDFNERKANYTNLDPGRYTFRVKASNHHGVWSDQERVLKVVILPPPWKTWWAYLLYTLALIGIFMAWRKYDVKRVKLKHRAEHLSELDHLKTQFFTNISHEFRTPITLIQGPLKELYNKSSNEEDRSMIGSMLRNAKRLSRLINQLLDISKIEAGKMTLHASPVELVQFLREIAASYESLAASKNIKYFFYPEVPELVAYIDAEKIEKVVHNLLSNAFKFTSSGEVIIHLKSNGKYGSISVKDTGIGIPAAQLDKIFDRFYQVDSSQTRFYEGSGLGMALAKELVELHHGTIAVESVEGKGTTFVVQIPLGKEYLSKDQMVDEPNLKKSETYPEDLVVVNDNYEPESEKTIEPDHHPILLIVEDNEDMRRYIRKTFAYLYQIIEACNGKEGITKAQEVIPDLIISDVMMPEMDGYKFCEYIKSSELTSHVPVILLTAKADHQSKLTGLETGADDYLAKPFDADELKLIVRNRIEQRKKIRERFSREITLEPKQISITSFDEKFINKVMTIIEARISDENFSIDELSREAGYSNMHFYRKIKALAGETPSQFLRTIRLKRAAELLRAKSDNITQIAYSVGFNSLSYFNRCFKEQFGVTPGQFAEERG